MFHRSTIYRRTSRTTIDGRAHSLTNSARQRAKQKGWDFNLTPEWVAERIKTGTCERTGIPFVLDPTKHKHAPSIDRVDNSKGYVKENCRIVAWAYNQAKNSYTDQELFDFALTLVKKHFSEVVYGATV